MERKAKTGMNTGWEDLLGLEFSINVEQRCDKSGGGALTPKASTDTRAAVGYYRGGERTGAPSLSLSLGVRPGNPECPRDLAVSKTPGNTIVVYIRAKGRSVERHSHPCRAAVQS